MVCQVNQGLPLWSLLNWQGKAVVPSHTLLGRPAAVGSGRTQWGDGVRGQALFFHFGVLSYLLTG